MKNLFLNINDDGVATVTFDRPGSSANIFDADTMAELESVIDEIESTSTVRNLIFLSAKPSIFIAGADISLLANATGAEMDSFLTRGQEIFSRIAQLPIGTAAAIHGACVGGGLELALACDIRVASPDKATKIGLPETLLGIIPAWGGSTRLPKLIGLPKALPLILGGKKLAPKHARKLGLVDDVVPRERLAQRAIQLLHQPPARKSHWKTNNRLAATVIKKMAIRDIMSKSRGKYPALIRAAEVVSAAGYRSESASLKAERDAVRGLVASGVTAQMIRLFFLTEKSKKTNIEDAGEVSPVTKCAVIGAGVMGAGIAHWVASWGISVLLKDINEEAVAKGMQTIGKRFSEGLKRRIFTKGEAAARYQLVAPAASDVPMDNVEMIIEAAVENMEIKKKIFTDLAGRTSDDTILATNTSALSITELASAVPHPERVAGLHFFNPVHRMKLVEIIHTDETSPRVAQTCLNFVRRLGKSPVLVKDSPGFLVNRILMPYLIEAGRLFETGVDPKKLDEAMLDFGMPVGPMQLLDDIGLDVALHVAETMENFFGDRMQAPAVLKKLVEAEILGRKTGAGFFVQTGDAKGQKNEAASAFVRGDNEMPRDEIASRLSLLMIAEGYRCLEEKIIESADDIDFAMIMGTGWAPFRGGPMKHSRTLGEENVKEQLQRYFEEDGAIYSVPNSLE